jgi:hypothetical protein
VSYDGRRDRLRAVSVTPRAACRLCGAQPEILHIDYDRYLAPSCAA